MIERYPYTLDRGISSSTALLVIALAIGLDTEDAVEDLLVEQPGALPQRNEPEALDAGVYHAQIRVGSGISTRACRQSTINQTHNVLAARVRSDPPAYAANGKGYYPTCQHISGENNGTD